jgi:hypothetical protein
LTPDGKPVAPVERLRDLARASVRLQRALTTTMFSRFLLGDLFIHGIGGAKYDSLATRSRRYFGFDPRGSSLAYLWLGLPLDPATPTGGLRRSSLARPEIQSDRYLDEPGRGSSYSH